MFPAMPSPRDNHEELGGADDANAVCVSCAGADVDAAFPLSACISLATSALPYKEPGFGGICSNRSSETNDGLPEINPCTRRGILATSIHKTRQAKRICSSVANWFCTSLTFKSFVKENSKGTATACKKHTTATFMPNEKTDRTALSVKKVVYLLMANGRRMTDIIATVQNSMRTMKISTAVRKVVATTQMPMKRFARIKEMFPIPRFCMLAQSVEKVWMPFWTS